jgi:hypothetical protein
MCSKRFLTWQEISFSLVTSTESRIPGGGLVSAIPSSNRLICVGKTGRHIPPEGKTGHLVKEVEMGSAMHWIHRAVLQEFFRYAECEMRRAGLDGACPRRRVDE